MKTAKTLILGMDPGLTGAIAYYNVETKKLEHVSDMPTTEDSRGKSHVDPYGLSLTIEGYRDETIGAVIESVGAAPKQGLATTFKFGYVTGVATGVIAAHRMSIHRIKPAVWKMIMGIGADKNEARAKARALFPEAADKFKRALDHGRAEAALMAMFGERIYAPLLKGNKR